MAEGLSSYPFTQRDFYGPLRTYDGEPHFPPRLEVYHHPEDEMKIIRMTEKVFGNGTDIIEQTDRMYGLLHQLDRFGIAHVNPSFFIEEEGTGLNQRTLGIVSELVRNTVACQDILADGVVTDDMFRELDGFFGKVARFVMDIEKNGGVVSDEVMQLSQFVYSPDLQPGSRIVLVDVEPWAMQVDLPHARSACLNEMLESLIDDVFTVSASRSEIPLQSRQLLMDAIACVDPNRTDDWLQRSLEKLRHVNSLTFESSPRV